MRLYFARKLFFIFFMSPLLCFFISPLCVAETGCVGGGFWGMGSEVDGAGGAVLKLARG